MTGNESLRLAASPYDTRIACISYRNGDPWVFRTLRVEFETVGAALDRVAVVTAPMSALRRWRFERVAARFPRASALAGALRARLSGRALPRCRLLVVSCLNLDDLCEVGLWQSLLPRADVSACILDEVYAQQLAENAGALRLLRRFDLVFVGCAGTVDALSRATGRECRYLAPSVDALGACPYPDAPRRVIDLYSMGRRDPEIHAGLLAYASRRDRFYLFDTAGAARVRDVGAHRRQLYSTIQRTRYFFVDVARADSPALTGGQEELGFRYFEGAAAGALMVGRLPRTESARMHFGWRDAVVPLDRAGAVERVLDELERSEERVERARRVNVANALRRHDHAHRWAEILDAAGLRASQALDERRTVLHALADAVERCSAPPAQTSASSDLDGPALEPPALAPPALDAPALDSPAVDSPALDPGSLQ